MNLRSWRFGILWTFLAIAAVRVAAAPLPVKTVEFYGESVGRKMKYNICLPAGYEDSSDRFPVLYLLHGHTSSYLAWARLGVPAYAQFYEMIVVMPDAGNSWYVNWAESEAGQKNAWEDFIIKDLIGYVDANYRTIATREGRAINGLSMGGYGALTLGLRHPDLFCSVGSESGALAFASGARERIAAGEPAWTPRRPLATEPNRAIGIVGFNSQEEREPKGRIFVTSEQCDAHDPFVLVKKVEREKLPHLCIDCGTEDGFAATTRQFAKLLMDEKIPFTYAQSEGTHAPPYWAREVGHAMAVQYHLLERNLGRQRVTLRRTPLAESGRGETSSFTARPGSWPVYSGELAGESEMRFKNANPFPIRVGLRSGGKGLDLMVPGGGRATARVPGGNYQIFFQTAGENRSIFEGKNFTLQSGSVDIDISELKADE